MHARTHARTHIYTDTYTHTHARTHARTHAHTNTHTHTHTHTHAPDLGDRHGCGGEKEEEENGLEIIEQVHLQGVLERKNRSGGVFEANSPNGWASVRK